MGLETSAPTLDARELSLYTSACWPTIIETGKDSAIGWRAILDRHSRRFGATLVIRSLLCGEILHNISRDPLTELKACQQSGFWLVLLHPNASSDVLALLVNEILMSSQSTKANSKFRLWIIVDSVNSELPQWVSRVSFRIRLEILAPNGLRGLSTALADQIDDETLRKAAQDLRLCKIVGSFCVMHATIVLRQRQRYVGWIQGAVSAEDFAAASNSLQLCLWPTTRAAAGRPLDWLRIRSVAEVDYSGSVDNPYDARTLCTIIRAFLSQGILAQRYEAFQGLIVPHPLPSGSGSSLTKLRELLQSALDPGERPEWLGLHPVCVNVEDPRNSDEVLELLASLFYDGGAAALPSDFSTKQLLMHELEQIRELAIQYQIDRPLPPNFNRNRTGSFKIPQRSARSSQADASSPAGSGKVIRRVPSKNLSAPVPPGASGTGKGKAAPSKGAKPVKRGSVIAIQPWEHPDHAVWEGPVLSDRENAICRTARKILDAIAALPPVMSTATQARTAQKSIMMAHLAEEQAAFNHLIKTAESILVAINAAVKGITERTSPSLLLTVWKHALDLEAGRIPTPILAISWPCPNVDSWIQARQLVLYLEMSNLRNLTIAFRFKLCNFLFVTCLPNLSSDFLN